METLQSPLSDAQLELLQMFARPVDDLDWQQIKALITSYFASKAIDEANKVWDCEGWDDTKVEQLLNTHLRTPTASHEGRYRHQYPARIYFRKFTLSSDF